MNVSRTDHGKITGEPENGLCRSAARLTRVRNPQARPLAVIQITSFCDLGHAIRRRGEPRSTTRLDKSLFRALTCAFWASGSLSPATRQAALALSKTAVFVGISVKSEHQRSRHLWGQPDRHRTLVRESYRYYWSFDPLVASSVRYVDRPQPATHPVKLPGRDRHARTS